MFDHGKNIEKTNLKNYEKVKVDLDLLICIHVN